MSEPKEFKTAVRLGGRRLDLSFLYYSDLSPRGVVEIKVVEEDGRMSEYHLPVQSLLEFTDHYRKELEECSSKSKN